MKHVNTAIFLMLMFCYAFITVVHIVAGQGLSEASIYEVKENSFQMYLCIAAFLLTVLVFLGNFFSLKKYSAEFWVMLAYMSYSVVCTSLSTLGYGSIKYTGTALIYGNLPILFFMAYYFCGRRTLLPNFFMVNYAMLLFLINSVFVFMSYFMWTEYSRGFVLMQFYQVFLLLPWLLIYNVKVFRIVLILMMGGVVAYASKRGAFICYVGGVILYFFVKNVFIENKFRALHIIGLPVILTIMGVIVFFFIDFSYLLDRMDRLDEDAGSGRLYIWQYVYDMYANSDLLSQMLGHGGYYGSRELLMSGNLAHGAHNDFLSALYDYGLVGFIMLISLFVLSIKRLWQMLKFKFEFAPAYAMWLFCFFVLANISALFCSPIEAASFFSFWGYVLGVFQKNLEETSMLQLAFRQ